MYFPLYCIVLYCIVVVNWPISPQGFNHTHTKTHHTALINWERQDDQKPLQTSRTPYRLDARNALREKQYIQVLHPCLCSNPLAVKASKRRGSQTLPGPTHVPHLEHLGHDQIGNPQNCAGFPIQPCSKCTLCVLGPKESSDRFAERR